MAGRVSRSILDPWLLPLGPRVYRLIHVPRRFPPEGIIAVGHILAMSGAVGFAFSTTRWWGGVIGAVGVIGNHLADMIDGTHARATGQCRNGGELLDHFTDPLSFAYWLIGLGVSVATALRNPWLGLGLALACVVLLFAFAVLTNIRAKMTGSFVLHSFGPTEFKTLLALYGCVMASLSLATDATTLPGRVAAGWLAVLALVGVVNLAWSLVWSVREVNRASSPPDTAEWVIRGHKSSEATREPARG